MYSGTVFLTHCVYMTCGDLLQHQFAKEHVRYSPTQGQSIKMGKITQLYT